MLQVRYKFTAVTLTYFELASGLHFPSSQFANIIIFKICCVVEDLKEFGANCGYFAANVVSLLPKFQGFSCTYSINSRNLSHLCSFGIENITMFLNISSTSM